MLAKEKKLIEEYLEAQKVLDKISKKFSSYFTNKADKAFANCSTIKELEVAYKEFSLLPNSFAKYSIYKTYEAYKNHLKTNQI